MLPKTNLGNFSDVKKSRLAGPLILAQPLAQPSVMLNPDGCTPLLRPVAPRGGRGGGVVAQDLPPRYRIEVVPHPSLDLPYWLPPPRPVLRSIPPPHVRRFPNLRRTKKISWVPGSLALIVPFSLFTVTALAVLKTPFLL